MRGRYDGCHMTIYGHILPGAIRIARWAARVDNLSPKAKYRLKIVDWLRQHHGNISLTARHFGLDRETVRNWYAKFQKEGPRGLNDKSKRPKNLRQPITSSAIIRETVKLRKQYPVWSKYKIVAILARQSIKTSASTVGRILKRKGLINKKVSRKRQKAALNPKQRYPHGLKISEPGDIIQLDTKYLTLVGGRRVYQFTAIDVLTKIRVLKIYSSESSKNGAKFLKYCLKKFPFAVKAVQTDNGSLWLKYFKDLCLKLRIPQYFIEARKPKQNTYVEISHGADEREFYLQGNVSSFIEEMQKRIEEWTYTWNEIRPHQALNYLTPNEYYLKWKKGRLPTKSVITLQT